MKKRSKNLTIVVKLIFILTVLFLTSSCKDEKAPVNPRTTLFKTLQGNWNIESVMLDDQELQGYEGFSLVLSKSTTPFVYQYQCVNRPELSPWKSNGFWEFGAKIELELIRDQGTADELEIEYSHTTNQLIIRFTFAGEGYNGRRASANGNWVFTFSR